MRLAFEVPERILRVLGFADEHGCLDSFFGALSDLEDQADEALAGRALCRLYDSGDALDFGFSVEAVPVNAQPAHVWRRGVIHYSPGENRWGLWP